MNNSSITAQALSMQRKYFSAAKHAKMRKI
jgi:hypothetical protein